MWLRLGIIRDIDTATLMKQSWSIQQTSLMSLHTKELQNNFFFFKPTTRSVLHTWAAGNSVTISKAPSGSHSPASSEFHTCEISTMTGNKKPVKQYHSSNHLLHAAELTQSTDNNQHPFTVPAKTLIVRRTAPQMTCVVLSSTVRVTSKPPRLLIIARTVSLSLITKHL